MTGTHRVLKGVLRVLTGVLEGHSQDTQGVLDLGCGRGRITRVLRLHLSVTYMYVYSI
jgi:hypothetical protein